MKETYRPLIIYSLVLLLPVIGTAEEVRISRNNGIELAFQNNRELAIAELAVARSHSADGMPSQSGSDGKKFVEGLKEKLTTNSQCC